MNQGKVGLTPAQQAEQQQAIQLNQDYWKTEAPLLATALSTVTPQAEAAEATTGEGQAAAGVRAASGTGIYRPNPRDAGAGPGSGAGVGMTGDKILDTAGKSTAAAIGAGQQAKGLYLNRVAGLQRVGSGLVSRANSALHTGAAIQAGEYQQKAEDKTADVEAFTNLATQAGKAGAMAFGA